MSFQTFMNKARKDRKTSEECFKLDVFEEDFKLKAISFTAFSALREKHSKLEFMTNTKKEKVPVKKTNEGALTLELCAKGICYPNLKNAELQDFYGVTDEIELIDAMLTASEIAAISTKIMQMSGITENINEVKEEAKN